MFLPAALQGWLRSSSLCQTDLLLIRFLPSSLVSSSCTYSLIVSGCYFSIAGYHLAHLFPVSCHGELVSPLCLGACHPPNISLQYSLFLSNTHVGLHILTGSPKSQQHHSESTTVHGWWASAQAMSKMDSAENAINCDTINSNTDALCYE